MEFESRRVSENDEEIKNVRNSPQFGVWKA